MALQPYKLTMLSTYSQPSNVFAGIEVSIFDSDLDSLATIYADENSTPLPNPTTSDELGSVKFWGTPEVNYEARADVAGQTFVTPINNSLNVDFTDSIYPRTPPADDLTYAIKNKVFVPITGVRDSVNIEEFGAVADNVTDSTAAIDAAIDTGLPIFVPPRSTGAFVYNGNNKLLPVGMLGNGNLSRIKCTANDKIFGVGLRSRVVGVRFIGNGKASGDTSQEVLYVEQGSIGDSSRGQFLITMNLFQDIGGTFFTSRTLVNTYEGGLVTMNQGRDSNVGFDFDERGEYTTVTSNNVTTSTTACIIRGGNTNVNGNNFSGNTNGVILESGTNDGHGNLIGNVVNHNKVNFTARGIQKETFSVLGNQFFVGDILLENTVGLKVAHCDISTGDILEQGATACYFESCNYHDNVNIVPNLTTPSEVFHYNPTGRSVTANSVGSSNAARVVGSISSNQTVNDAAVDDVIFGSLGQSLPFNTNYTVQSFYDGITGEINGDAYIRDYGLHIDAKVILTVGRVSAWDNANVDLEVYDSTTGDTVLVATKGQVVDNGGTFTARYNIDGKLRKNSKYKMRLRNNSGQALFIYGTGSGQLSSFEAWGF